MSGVVLQMVFCRVENFSVPRSRIGLDKLLALILRLPLPMTDSDGTIYTLTRKSGHKIFRALVYMQAMQGTNYL
jgi:hypothetical protein